MTPRLSTTALVIALTAGAALAYAAVVLYGAWIDGRRQKMREKGLHPVTEANGTVKAREQENGDGKL